MRKTNASIAIGLVATLGLGIPANCAVPGDVDGDGQVTANDARVALMIASGQFHATSPMVTNGDVASDTGNTPDGHVSLLDAVRILRAVNGLDTLGGVGGGAAKAATLSDSLTLTISTTKNYKLPPGFTISGTARDTFGQSITSQAGLPLVTGTVNFAAASNPALTGSGPAAAVTGAYSSVLGGATYNVTIESSVVNVDLGTGKFTSYTVLQPAGPPSLTVSADATQNFVRPPLPQPGTVAGTVSGSNTTIQSVTLTLDSGSSQGQPASGSYSLAGPPGTGHISVAGKYAPDSTVGFGEYQFSSPVSLASGATVTHNVTVPILGGIHGSVTVPATTAFSSVFAGNYLFTVPGTVDEFFSIYTNQAANPGAYHLALPPGTYPVLFNLSYPSKPNSTTTINYVTQASFTSADVVQNFTLPALGAAIVLNGSVQDPTGKALSGATVSLVPHNPGTTPSGYYSTANATTDASGNYSMNILPGTYDVLVGPPQG